MKQFERPTVISGAAVGELRVREIGRSPSVVAKISLMTVHGETTGMFLMHQFSERSNDLLRALLASIEGDACDLLTAGDPRGDLFDGEEGNEEPFDNSSDLLR